MEANSNGHISAAEGAVGFWPNQRGAYYVLFILAAVMMLSVLDLQMLAKMIELIKEDFGLTDTQAALLLGASFSMPFAFFSILFAFVSDLWNRKHLLAACLVLMGVMAILLGLSQSYTQMFLARMGMGIGQAGIVVAAWPMLADTFPREKLALATGIAGMGSKFVQGAALVSGGAAFAMIMQFPPLHVPFLGEGRPWQWPFVIVGVLTLVVGVLLHFTVTEPPRRGMLLINDQRVRRVPFAAFFKFIFANRACYSSIILSKIALLILPIHTISWMPTLFIDKFAWSLTDIGLMQGGILLVVTPVAYILGGMLSARWMKQGMWDANFRIIFYSILAMALPTILFPLMPNPWLYFGLYGLSHFAFMFGFGPMIATLLLVTPNQMRAQMGIIVGFIVGTFVSIFGFFSFGVITDVFSNDAQNLKYSMALSAAVVMPIAAVITWYGIKPYGRSVERAAKEFV